MLAFAAALHAGLAGLESGAGGATETRIGIATGEASFLISEARSGAGAFSSVQGDVVCLAAQMEALARPGAAYVHRSTVDRWAKETRRPPPATVQAEGKGGRPLRAAVFDCAAGAFAAAAAAAPIAASIAAAAGEGLLAKRLRRASSAAF